MKTARAMSPRVQSSTMSKKLLDLTTSQSIRINHANLSTHRNLIARPRRSTLRQPTSLMQVICHQERLLRLPSPLMNSQRTMCRTTQATEIRYQSESALKRCHTTHATSLKHRSWVSLRRHSLRRTTSNQRSPRDQFQHSKQSHLLRDITHLQRDRQRTPPC